MKSVIFNDLEYQYETIETKSTPKEIFRIKADSLNPNLSKDWWKEKISEQLKILKRKEELIKGELC